MPTAAVCVAAATAAVAKSIEVGKTVFVVVTVTVTTEAVIVVGIPDTVRVESVVGMAGGDTVEMVDSVSVWSCFNASMVANVLGRWPMVVVAIVGRAKVPVNVTRVRESSSSRCVSSPLGLDGRTVENLPETSLTVWLANTTCPSTLMLVMSRFLRRTYS